MFRERIWNKYHGNAYEGTTVLYFLQLLKHVDPLSHMFGATPKNATEERE